MSRTGFALSKTIKTEIMLKKYSSQFIALLALCLFLVGCGTTPEGINQTSKLKVGTPIWEFAEGRWAYSSPAIGSDGTVYVGSNMTRRKDKKLYAIKTDSKGLAKSPWPMRRQNEQHTGRVMKK